MYQYVGPASILEQVRSQQPGTTIHSEADLSHWCAQNPDYTMGAIFVVLPDYSWRIALRRTEHVVCAGASPVLSAGELWLARRDGIMVVPTITNQSTGYCPLPESWLALTTALTRSGIVHPQTWTHAFTMVVCSHCRTVNLIKDQVWECAYCDRALR